MPSVKELLTKLGMAIYLHKGQIKMASKAKEAVRYLHKMGVLSGRPKSPGS
jgi:hypothetical protein